jgi:hypothetical protein
MLGAIIGGALSIGSKLLSSKGGGKLKYDPERLDMDELVRIASEQARRNIKGGIELEREFDPYTAAARDEAMKSLFSEAGRDRYSDLEMRLMGELGKGDQAIDMPELERSALLDKTRALALDDLDLGYALPPDVANLVARTAAGKTSGAGTLGGLGRDVAARDLGLTSLDLFDRRMDRAAGLGMHEEQTNIGQQGLAANIAQANRAYADSRTRGLIGQIGDMRGQQLRDQFGLAQFMQGIDRPVAGIDPGALASAYIADINMANLLKADVALNRQAQKGKKYAGLGGAMGVAGDFVSSMWG